MSDTPLLNLPLLAAEQAQKHVTMNEALGLLDAVVQLAVKDRDLATPPASPAEGDRYIVAAGATGAWAGKTGQLAIRQNGGWTFRPPREGWRCWVDDEGALLVFNGSAWDEFSGTASELHNLALLGVGTTADATNPLSAKLNKALWTAKTLAEGGDGDLRYTMNKEATPDVLSLLLQTGFSGRAEIGLIGDDNLTFKVSPDGSVWTAAIVVDRTTGAVQLGTGTSSAPSLAIGAAAVGFYSSASERVDLKTGVQTASFVPGFGFQVTSDTGVGFNGQRYQSGVLGVNYDGGKARGTIAAPADVVLNDELVRGRYSGWGGGGLRTVAEWRVTVIEPTPSGTAMGTRYTMALAPLGSVTRAEMFRLEYDTGLSMYGANPVIDQNRHFRLRSYTIAALPAASAAAGQMIYCSDLGGGGGQLNSDGTNWRRVSRGGQQTVSSDAAFTLTTLTSAEEQRHTGTLTANRTVTLSTTNAYAGARFRVTRTGAGAFNLDVGGLKGLATNTWCEVVYDGSAWSLAAYGAL